MNELREEIEALKQKDVTKEIEAIRQQGAIGGIEALTKNVSGEIEALKQDVDQSIVFFICFILFYVKYIERNNNF